MNSEFDREVRLGLVLYGGVSLAIYINGVTHEFWRAVRGLGPYSLLKELIGADILVDVISGTSAGGINGLMLSYALANDRNFSAFANLWRQHGDIDRLMRDPDVLPDETKSLLDGEGYYQEKLERALRDVFDQEERPPAGPHLSEADEIDLFVTSTDVEGNIFTTFDDSGHEIDIKEHRAMFRLKYRKGRRNDFGPIGSQAQSPETIQALATLARATSAFPAAFPPVHVKCAPAGDGSADSKLQTWGKLGKEAYLVDGGVLDNKPFTHTLSAIFHRVSNRDLDRRLFYVEPDPERFTRPLAAREPDFIETIVKSVSGIPMYESISADLELLRAHNRKIERYLRLCESVEGKGPGDQDVYNRARLIVMCDRAIEGILRVEGRNVAMQGEERVAARKLVQAFDELVIGAAQEDIDRFEIDRRLRCAFHQSYVAAGLMSSTPGAREALVLINDVIQMFEIFKHWMEYVVDQSNFNWKNRTAAEVWAHILSSYAHLLNADGFPAITACNSGERKQVYDCLRNRAREVVAGLPAAPPPGWKSALTSVDRVLATADLPEPLRVSLNTFHDMDSHVYPMQVVADLHERDLIDVTRISPLDAQQGFSRRALEEKVSGDALFHFGGFLKRSWRSNDIMWGRLDSLCELFECLFSYEGNKTWRVPPLADRLGEIFPALPPGEREALSKWLKTGQAANKEEFLQMQRRLIRAAQLQIIDEELWNVYADAFEQEAEWNRTRADGVWKEFPGFRDRYLSAAKSLMHREEMRMEVVRFPGGLPAFFQEKYHVGSEELSAAVPLIVQLHLLSKAALVIRNCVANALGKRRALVPLGWPFRVLAFGIRLVYWYFAMRRRWPKDIKALEITLIPAALAVLSIAAYLSLASRSLIFVVNGAVSPWRFFVFVTVPVFLVILGVIRLRERWSWVGGALIAFAATSGLFAAGWLFRMLELPDLSRLTPQQFGWVVVALSTIASFAGGALYKRATGPATRSAGDRRKTLAGLTLREILSLAAARGIDLRKAMTNSVDGSYIERAGAFGLSDWEREAQSPEAERVRVELCSALNLEGGRDYHKVGKFARRRYFSDLDEAIDRILQDRKIEVKTPEAKPARSRAAASGSA